MHNRQTSQILLLTILLIALLKVVFSQKVEMELNCRKPREDENRGLSRERKKILDSVDEQEVMEKKTAVMIVVVVREDYLRAKDLKTVDMVLEVALGRGA